MNTPPRATPTPRDDWRRQLVGSVREIQPLIDDGLIDPAQGAELARVTARYRMQVSAYYLGLVDWNDPDCPIRKQAIPDAAELLERPMERPDPIGDAAHSPTELLIHRYPDRALLLPTLRCPMYCRYCFRKVALNTEDIRLHQALDESITYLSKHPEIKEIILSGGDPLLLPDARLGKLLERVLSVPSIKRLRIHTRVPVTLPMRVDDALAEVLGQARPLYLVAHFNHPRELTTEATEALERLVRAGVTVLNQSVLLKGVNDSAEVLAELCEALVDRQVRPYYLHHPDLTVGTQHFRVSIDDGLALVKRLRGRLTGLAWPTYVIDIPGGLGKVPVDSSHVRRGEHPGEWWMESPLGGVHRYLDPAVIVDDATPEPC
ncbi:MAG: KamA family radical SAM protein [Bradymonadia bacterium]